MSRLSEDEIQQAADLLAKLQPGFLPLPIFIQLARLTVTPVIELVPLRLRNDTVEVLLMQRPPDDPTWPGLWHTPGTVLRATDQEGSYRDAFERLLNDELAGVIAQSEPQFVETLFHQVKRGRECAQVFYMEVSGEPIEGKYFAAEKLPENTVDTQWNFIKHAVRLFRQARGI